MSVIVCWKPNRKSHAELVGEPRSCSCRRRKMHDLQKNKALAHFRHQQQWYNSVQNCDGDMFLRLSSAFMPCLFSLWFRRFMFCILLRISRILDYVLLQASVVEPAWERSHKGEWMFTLGDSLSWAVLLGLPSTLRMCCENLLPFWKSFFFFFFWVI